MVKQITYYKDFNIIKSHQKSIILIGNFDGLHLGHQKLFNKAKDYKKKKKSNKSFHFNLIIRTEFQWILSLLISTIRECK